MHTIYYTFVHVRCLDYDLKDRVQKPHNQPPPFPIPGFWTLPRKKEYINQINQLLPMWLCPSGLDSFYPLDGHLCGWWWKQQGCPGRLLWSIVLWHSGCKLQRVFHQWDRQLHVQLHNSRTINSADFVVEVPMCSLMGLVGWRVCTSVPQPFLVQTWISMNVSSSLASSHCQYLWGSHPGGPLGGWTSSHMYPVGFGSADSLWSLTALFTHGIVATSFLLQISPMIAHRYWTTKTMDINTLWLASQFIRGGYFTKVFVLGQIRYFGQQHIGIGGRD